MDTVGKGENRWMGKAASTHIQYHQFNGHKLGQTAGDGERQGGRACYGPRVAKSWTEPGDWITTKCKTEVAIWYKEPSLVPCDDLEGWDGGGEGGL